MTSSKPCVLMCEMLEFQTDTGGGLDSQRLLIAGHGVYYLWALSCWWNDNLLFWSQALHNYFKSRLIRLWRWISAICFPPCNSSSPSTHFSLGIHTLVSKTSTEILHFILSVVDTIQMSLYFVKCVCGLQTFWEILKDQFYFLLICVQRPGTVSTKVFGFRVEDMATAVSALYFFALISRFLISHRGQGWLPLNGSKFHPWWLVTGWEWLHHFFKCNSL